jgi:hypothetical protein
MNLLEAIENLPEKKSLGNFIITVPIGDNDSVFIGGEFTSCYPEKTIYAYSELKGDEKINFPISLLHFFAMTHASKDERIISLSDSELRLLAISRLMGSIESLVDADYFQSQQDSPPTLLLLVKYLNSEKRKNFFFKDDKVKIPVFKEDFEVINNITYCVNRFLYTLDSLPNGSISYHRYHDDIVTATQFESQIEDTYLYIHHYDFNK